MNREVVLVISGPLVFPNQNATPSRCEGKSQNQRDITVAITCDLFVVIVERLGRLLKLQP